MEMDSIYRGGGPIFYRHFSYNLSIENNARQRDRSDLGYDSQGAAARYALQQSNFRPGDVLFLSSVSGRTKHVVDLAYEAVQMGIKVIAFTSMEYAVQVEPVHPSGKKRYEIATLTLDNCVAVEKLLEKGITPGILKSANFPGGADYNKTVVEPNYDKYGW